MKASVEVTSVEAFISSISSMELPTEVSMKTSVEVTFMKVSITSAKASITSMKAFMEDFVEATSMEAYVEDFVDSPVEVTSVEAFISSISSMEASTEAPMKLPWKLLP